MGKVKRALGRLRFILLTLILLSWQVVFAGAPFFQPSPAHAASSCVNDTAGANDEPGQKDLTKLCIDDSGLSNNPKTEVVSWDWDELGTSGNNTLDACGLFDTDGDTNVNYAICVTTKGGTATIDHITIYSCGDGKKDRCTSQVNALPTPYQTTCSVAVVSGADPFPAGDAYPADTVATCTFNLSDINQSSAQLTDVCSYPSQQPNSDPSDCVIIQNNPVALVELKKQLVPNTDPGRFNLTIDGPGTDDTSTVTDQGDGGTTGIVGLNPGQHGSTATVSEAAYTGTDLSNYNSSISCVTRSTGAAVTATGSGPSWQIPIKDGDNIVCTITNTRQQATLILQKTVVNDNGGQLTESDFPVAIDGTTSSWGSHTVNPGTYTVSETNQTGYQAGSWGGDCNASGQVTLANGDTKTCTITNDDIAPRLTVIKHVVNDNGGNAKASDFTMNVTGTNVSSPSFAGSESPGTTVTLNAGSYSVDEGSHTGYDESKSGDCNGTIAIGETKTCTITNDDIAPSLTVTKLVDNPYGTALPASSFPLYVDSTSVNSGQTYNSFDAGNHTISEDQQSGYSFTGVSGDCTYDQNTLMISIVLSLGTSSTCTLTNTAIQPKLTVIKHVINDDGGNKSAGDFTMTVSGNSATVPNFPGSESGTTVGLNEGNYSVDEQSHDGYAESFSGDCDSTISIGDTRTCTITNNDIAPTLTLIKNVSGGDATPSDWTLSATPSDNHYTTLSGAGGFSDQTARANLEYTLSESSSTTGYTAGLWSCDGGTLNGNVLTLQLDTNVTCSITNTRDTGHIEVVKDLYPSNDSGLFDLHISGPTTYNRYDVGDGGTTNNRSVLTGDYTVSETAGTNTDLSNYESSYSCTNGLAGDGTTSTSFTVSKDESVVCTFTNKRHATITVKKNLDDGFGNISYNVNTWKYDIDGSGSYQTGSSQELPAGDYAISEEGQADYHFTSVSCTDNGQSVPVNQDVSFSITASPGSDIVCTFTNTRDTGTITVVKDLNPGTDTGKFGLQIDGVTKASDVGNNGTTGAVTVTTGLHNVDELADTNTSLSHYESSYVCMNGRQTVASGNSTLSDLFSVGYGDNIVCTFTNERHSTITVIKNVDDGFGNVSKDVATWTWGYDGGTDYGNNLTTGSTNTQEVVAGNYSVWEDSQQDYHFTSVSCSNDIGLVSVDNLSQFDVTLDPGENLTCTYLNTRDTGTITVHKSLYPSTDSGLFNLNINGPTSYTATDQGDNGTTGTQTVLTGSYMVSEAAGTNTSLDGYNSRYDCWSQNGEHFTFGPSGSATTSDSFTISNGDNMECWFTNIRLGTLTGTKFNDYNKNGKQDTGEPGLKDWTIQLYECQQNIVTLSLSTNNQSSDCTSPALLATTTTDTNGNYTFNNLQDGDYRVCEVQQNGWTQTFPADNNGCIDFTINIDLEIGKPGQVVTANFGNVKKVKPVVLAAKTELVNTGANALATIFAGLAMLGLLGAVTRAAKKQ